MGEGAPVPCAAGVGHPRAEASTPSCGSKQRHGVTHSPPFYPHCKDPGQGTWPAVLPAALAAAALSGLFTRALSGAIVMVARMLL